MSDLNPAWPRIGGFSALPNGDMGIVWLSYEPEWDIIRVHQAIPYTRAHLGLIASELKRNDWIPVAWANEPFAEELRTNYRCRMLKDGVNDSAEKAEEITNVLAERAETQRLKVNKGLDAWADEFERFNRSVKGDKLPRDTHPLMAATRYAVAKIQYARKKEASLIPEKKLRRRMAIV